MLKHSHRGWRIGAPGGRIVLLFLGVAITILFVGKKVELDGLDRSLEQTRGCIVRLGTERARLMATITFKQKPGVIERIACGRLGMDYSSGRLSDLTFDAPRETGLE